MVCMYVWGNIHTETRRGMNVCMYVCMYAWSKGTYLQSIPSMYVCPGKHTYLENDRNVWYVCMSGETYIPRQEEVCMYVCLYAWSKRTYIKSTGMYVSGRHRRVIHTQYVCMYVRGNIHTQKIRGMYGMYVCLGKHTYLEKKRYVCMYAWSKRTYLKSTGMFVSRIHGRVVHTQYVCMSGGETYIPRK